MARQGRAGSALAIAAIGSFVGGTAATIALVVVAIPLATLALKFGPAEFFALMVVGLCLVIGLAGRTLLAALLMTVLGLLLAMIGLDPVRGAPRFTFGMPELYDGIGFVPVVMGLFGIGEILLAAERRETRMIEADLKSLAIRRARGMAPASAGAIGRGTASASCSASSPASAPSCRPSWPTCWRSASRRRRSASATARSRASPRPETANNAYANAAMMPLLALGMPSSPTIAVLMGAFIVNGITPGPFLFTGAAGARLGGDRQLLRRQRRCC